MPGAGRAEPAAVPVPPFSGRSARGLLTGPLLRIASLLLPGLLLLAGSPAVALSPAPAPPDGLLLLGTLVEGESDGAAGTGNPDRLAGVRVELLPALDPWQRALSRLEGETIEAVAVTRSDAEGRYRLTAPEAGLWRLRLSAPGRFHERAVVAYLSEETHRPLAVPSRRELEIRAVDPQDRPVAGARIAATRIPTGGSTAEGNTGSSGLDAAPELFARTGDDGRVLLAIPPGLPLRLTVLAPGFAPASLDLDSETTGRDRPAARVRLGPGIRRSVRVRDTGDRPVRGAVVLLGEPAVPAGRTDDRGSLEFLAPTGAALPVRALMPDLRSALGFLEPPGEEPHGEGDAEDPATGSGSEGPPLVLALEDPPELFGQVVENGSRSPLPGALLWAPGAGQAVTTSGPRGRYRLRLPRTPEESFRLTAILPGYLPQGVTVRPEQARSAGSRDPLPTLALRPAAAVTGTVVDSRGEAVPDVELRVVSRTHRRRGDAISGPRGRFFIAPLSPGGPVRLYAERAGYAPATVDLPPLQPHRTVTGVRVVLPDGRTAHGRVISAEEEPVAGAEVWLLPRSQNGSMRVRFFERRRALGRDPSLSDTEGAFRIEHIAPGAYNLRVETPGFAPAEVPGIEVPTGEEPLDLGTVMVEAAVRVTGRVVDPDDRPVAGARIQAIPRRSGVWRGARGRSFEGTSDAAGHFTLGDLRRGEPVTLLAEKPGYAGSRLVGVEVPTEAPVELVLEPAARVSGRVRDPEGRPVEDAAVVVDLSGGRGWRGRSGTEPTRTDPEGRFTLVEVPPGDVTLHAHAEGFLRDGLVHVEVEPGAHLEDVEITLTPGATVLGRVVGPGGEPLPEARVRLLEEARSFGPGGTAHTDGDGRYRMEGIPPGARSFVAVHESHPRATRDLEVGTGENRLDFRLSAGQEVSGRVVDSVGSPVAGARVRLNGVTREENRSEVSGSDGSFHFTGIADGSYRLDGHHPEHGEAILEEPLEVRGASRSGIELRFEQVGVIRGRITGLGLDELAGIDVRAFSSAGANRWARPDFEGRFRLEGLRPGTWTVVAFSPGGRRVSEEVKLPEAAPEADVELEFLPGFTLTGQVLVGSEPLERGSVSVRRRDDRSGGFDSLDHRGRFRIEGLEEGTHLLRVLSPGGVGHRREVEISGDRDLLIELETASLTGRVLDASSGEPLAGVEVRMSRMEGGDHIGDRFGATRTDTTGLFRFRQLTAGGYRADFSKEGYGRVERAVELASGVTESLEVRLEPAQGLVLRLTWTDGLLPAPWVQVVARGPDGRSGVSGGYAVGENGTVRLTSLPAGNWEIRVSARGAAVTTVQAAAPGPAVPVTLRPQARLELTVPDLIDGDTDATVEILGPDGRPLPLLGTRSSTVLRRGRGSLDQLPAGTWTVRVTTTDGRAWNSPVVTRAGQTAQLVLR